MSLIKHEKSEKTKERKTFLLWMIVGTIIWGACNFIFYFNSNRYVTDIIPDNTVITEGNSKIEFQTPDQTEYDVIDLYVDMKGVEKVNAYLYSSVSEGDRDILPEDKRISFIARDGLNEMIIPITPKMMIEFDLENSGINNTDLNDITIHIGKIELRKSRNPSLVLPVALVFFLIIWASLFGAFRYLGIKINKVEDAVAAFFEGITALAMIIIIATTGLNNSYPMIYIVLISLVAVFFCMKKYIQMNEDELLGRLSSPGMMSIYFLVYAVLLVMAGNDIITQPVADHGEIYESACEIVNNGVLNTEITGKEAVYWATFASNNDYFVIHPQNRFLLAYLTVYYKVLAFLGLKCPSYNAVLAGVYFNIFHIWVSVLIGSKCAGILFGNKGRLMYCILAFAFIPYYVNTGMFYTDTISMPYLILTIFVYLLPEDRFRHRITKYMIAGFTAAIGTLLKGSVMVVLIAILLHLLIRMKKEHKTGMYIVGLLICFVFVSSLCNRMIDKTGWINTSYKNYLELPKVHYLMMGMNHQAKGGYSQSDYNYTTSFGTKQEKTKACLSLLSERLADFDSLKDYINFNIEKLKITWGNGGFFENYVLEKAYKKGFLYSIIYEDKSGFAVYYSYRMIYIFVLYFLILLGSLKHLGKTRGCSQDVFLKIALSGTIALLLLWESKSRYLINFTPLLMLCGCGALYEDKLSTSKDNQVSQTKC